MYIFVDLFLYSSDTKTIQNLLFLPWKIIQIWFCWYVDYGNKDFLWNFTLFSFHHRLVFRVTMFIYKIINFSSAPIQLKKWLKPSMLDNERYDLRSNQTILFWADHTCLRFGDITFKNSFGSYLNNIMEHIFIKNFKKFYNQLLFSLNDNLRLFLNVLPKFNCTNNLRFSLKRIIW